MLNVRSLVVIGTLALARIALPAEPTAEAILAVRGMTCGGCVAAVKLQLERTDGVTAYEVSLERAEAHVTYDPQRTEPKKIAESVSKTGFSASVKEPKPQG